MLNIVKSYEQLYTMYFHWPKWIKWGNEEIILATLPELSKEVHEERPVQVLTQLIQNKPERMRDIRKRDFFATNDLRRCWNSLPSLKSGSCLGLNDGKTKVDCFGTLTCWGGSGLSGQHQKPFCLAESAPALSIFTGGLKVTFRHNSISRSSLHF